MKFGALGRTHWLADSIRRCRARHELVILGTAPPSPEYRAAVSDFEDLAREAGCPFFIATQLQPMHAEMITTSGAEVVISVNWPSLIPIAVLEACRQGVVNAHAGDLPRFRGNACPNWAILTGESQVVLTLHRMTPVLDAGPIFIQRSFSLTEDTYITDVYRFLDGAVPELFSELLDTIASVGVTAVEQSRNPADSLRCFPRLPQDGEIDWREPAQFLGRLVRASAEPFAGAYTWMHGRRLTVWRAKPTTLPYPYHGMPGQVVERDVGRGEVTVLAGEGALVLTEVQLVGGGATSSR